MRFIRYKIRLIYPLPFEIDRLPQLTIDQKISLKIDHICSRMRRIIQERLKNETTKL